MSPKIVPKDGRPILTLGAAGGPTIISQVVLGLTNRLDLEMPLDAALAAPRIHHQWRPDLLVVEKRLPREMVESLRAFGHEIEQRERMGTMQGIAHEQEGFIAAHDPRVKSRATAVQARE